MEALTLLKKMTDVYMLDGGALNSIKDIKTVNQLLKRYITILQHQQDKNGSIPDEVADTLYNEFDASIQAICYNKSTKQK